MIINLIFVSVLLAGTRAAVPADLMEKVPGYGDDFKTKVYSGYLNTADPSRRLHYVFVESVKGANNSDPVTLWLNGGPGCSSLLGFLQQIGPYYIEEGKNYTKGDSLTPNPYSWHRVSNLLFLESPAGVGYSINRNRSFQYNDLSTLQDNFNAVLNFFASYPEYKKNSFWIAGESYAGKYIPDLAYRIDHYNLEPATPADKKIKLLGIFIGNGIIDFRGDSLWESTVEFLIHHDVIDPTTIPYWQAACRNDEESAGCQFFYTRVLETLEDINPFNLYSYCYYNDSFVSPANEEKKQFFSQESILRVLSKSSKNVSQESIAKSKFNGADCMYWDGLYQYFNTHYKEFHATQRESQQIKWNGPCAEEITINYMIDQSGSTRQLEYLFNRLKELFVVLYNGDWDTVVPYVDTLKNLERLKLQPFVFTPINMEDGTHVGFNTLMSGISFITIKGGSHQVPQTKRPEIFYVYDALLKSYPGRPLTF